MRACLLAVLAIWLAVPSPMDAGKRQRIDSRWRDRDIAIDGDSGDWIGPLRALDEVHPITAAVVNDAQFLYLVLTTGDPVTRRQIVRQGLIVWFDPDGGDTKRLGIRFPLGLIPGMPAPRPDRVDIPNAVDVYGPAKDNVARFVNQLAPGIAVDVGQVEGYLVYEVKVPLVRSVELPYAVEAKPGASIGLGIEIPKLAGRAGGSDDLKPWKLWATVQLAAR
jgi:hypothetical protein